MAAECQFDATLPPYNNNARAPKPTRTKTISACVLVLCLGLSLAFFFVATTTQRTAPLLLDQRPVYRNDDGRRHIEDLDAYTALFEAAPPKLANIKGPCSSSSSSSNMTTWVHHRWNETTTATNSDSDDCPRSFKFTRSVISEQDAARVRCSSSLANAVRKTPSRLTHQHQQHQHSNASICVFYLNYRNLDNLVTSVKTHSMRSSSPDLVSHTVLTMDEDESDVNATRQALGSTADVHRLIFPPGTRGGDPLPLALRLISLFSSCPLTVVSDSDAFMLKDGWDQRLLTAFLNPQLALFASNPRHHSHGEAFRDVAEWNWMAYRTEAFAGLVIGGGKQQQHIDVGHYYSSCVPDASQRLHLRGTAWPYEGKAATVVTDTDGSPWILHLFYASRHANEPDDIKAEARKYSLTDQQLAELRFNLTRTRSLDPRVAFG